MPRIILAIIGSLLFTAGIFDGASQPSNTVTSAPVFVPNYSHAISPLPNGIIAWDAEQKTTDATNGQASAEFDFKFANISPNPITILEGHGSCSCTTVALPQTPWVIPAAGTGEFVATINLAGKVGKIFKYAIITTDKGTKNLLLTVNIPPPPAITMNVEQRARGIAAAKLDRQAVFKGDCVNCHAKNIGTVYDGRQLFEQVCAVCHEATPRATMVPDLHNLKEQTSAEFWRAWITSGKAGTLMPAFSSAQGGPLNDMQIASLAAYLNSMIPPHAPPAAK
jgi:mono/diheme cytochrome c family protein